MMSTSAPTLCHYRDKLKNAQEKEEIQEIQQKDR